MHLVREAETIGLTSVSVYILLDLHLYIYMYILIFIYSYLYFILIFIYEYKYLFIFTFIHFHFYIKGIGKSRAIPHPDTGKWEDEGMSNSAWPLPAVVPAGGAASFFL